MDDVWNADARKNKNFGFKQHANCKNCKQTIQAISDNLARQSAATHNFIGNHSHATISLKMSHFVQKVGRCQGACLFLILVLRDCSGGFVSPRSLHRGAQACHFRQTQVKRWSFAIKVYGIRYNYESDQSRG